MPNKHYWVLCGARYAVWGVRATNGAEWRGVARMAPCTALQGNAHKLVPHISQQIA